MGRNYKKDTIQFLHISRGSAYEVETLLSVALMIKIIDEQSYNRINAIIGKKYSSDKWIYKLFRKKIIIRSTVNGQRSTINANMRRKY